MAEANASGIKPSNTAVYCAYGIGLPTRNGMTYAAMNGTAPSPEPHTIQRNCRRAVTDRR